MNDFRRPLNMGGRLKSYRCLMLIAARLAASLPG